MSLIAGPHRTRRCDSDEPRAVAVTSKLLDRQARQILLQGGSKSCDIQILYSSDGDVSALEVEPREVGQPLQLRQASIGDSRVAEVEFREVGQPLQMHKPGVGDSSLGESKSGECGQPFQMR